MNPLRKALSQGWLEKIAFALAILAVAFGAGVASAHFQTFPYTTFKEAAAALKAQSEFEDLNFPANVTSWEAKPSSPTVATLDPRAGAENLLMVGGFYSRMDVCPKAGCLAWIMDRNGRIIYSWPAPDPKDLFKDIKGFSGQIKPESFYIIGLAIEPDGSLITNFHGRNLFPYQVGTAKFDRNGALVWKRFDNSHHWPTVDAAGQILTPYAKTLKSPALLGETRTAIECEDPSGYTEGLRILGPDNVVRREFSIEAAIVKADYPGLVYSLKDGCDPFHANGIAVIPPAGAAKLGVKAGDYLISLREPSALIVLDKDTGDLKHVISGRTSGQHSPHFMPDGDIVVFDNQGGPRALGGSRILRINPATNQTKTLYPLRKEQGAPAFYSETSGVLAVSPDGTRILASLSKQGRVVEVDVASGTALWTYDAIMDFSAYRKERGLKGDKSYARPWANGAYYIGEPAFLRR